MSLSRKIADPLFVSENPLYVVGRSGEKRSHYVRACHGWAEGPSLCEQEPGVSNWNARRSMHNVCMVCHAAACRMPCEVKPAPDPYFTRDRYHAGGGKRWE